MMVFQQKKRNAICLAVAAVTLAACNGGGDSNSSSKDEQQVSSVPVGSSNSNSSTAVTNQTTATTANSAQSSVSGAWEPRQFLGTTGVSAHGPQAVIDQAGNVATVWTECANSTGCNARGRIYNNSTKKWGSILKVDHDFGIADWHSNQNYRGNRRYIDLSGTGTALTVFGTKEGRIAASLINPSTNEFQYIQGPETTPECVRPINPTVSIDPSGNYAIATWNSTFMSFGSICGGIIDLSTQTWKNIRLLNVINNEAGTLPTTVTTGSGQGYVAWPAGNRKVVVVKYDGNSWLPENVISTGTAYGIYGHVALMPFNGKLYAAWGGNAAGSTVRFNVLNMATEKWGTESKMTEPTYVSGSTDHVAFYARGNTLTASWVYNAPPNIGYLATLQSDGTWKQVSGPSVWNNEIFMGVLDDNSKIAFTKPYGYLSTSKMDSNNKWAEWKNIGDNAVNIDNSYAYSRDGRYMTMVWVGAESNNNGGVFANIFH